ncbi:YppG family protein [Bacillus sp. MUM 13]|uniref:YppG family protein n=1 Tax=Bacillus sp. MUM 13 TaxID=1678001 RepID=UPI000B231412|nr:YppG family protein [Bacillus sp. MUM 13]
MNMMDQRNSSAYMPHPGHWNEPQQQGMPYYQPGHHQYYSPYQHMPGPYGIGEQYGSYHPFMQQAQPAMPVNGHAAPYQQNNFPMHHAGQSFSPFTNPLQQGAKKAPSSLQQAFNPNPYPKQPLMQKPQSSGIGSVLNQFKTQDGSIDINKMMNTAGQMMSTMNQVSSMVKGVGSIFKV